MSRRVAIISNVLPVVEPLVDVLRGMGHDPIAWLMGRRPNDGRPLPPWGEVTDRNAPQGVNLLLARKKDDVAPLFRGLDLDVTLCWGFNWKLPQEALDVPRLGAINVHPSKLPLYRGPIPLPWAVRNGETEIAMTVHRMDATYDTGAILAQAPVPVDPEAWTFEEIIPHFQTALRQIIPRALERIAAGDEGESQEGDPGVYAAWFEDDFKRIDWSKPAREIHNQVRAWSFAGFIGDGEMPVGEVDGEPRKIIRTSLEPAEGTRVETGDGPIWVTESEPA